MDRGLGAVEIFAGKGGGRPAKYDDLLKIADGRISSDAPQALQDKAREVDRRYWRLGSSVGCG